MVSARSALLVLICEICVTPFEREIYVFVGLHAKNNGVEKGCFQLPKKLHKALPKKLPKTNGGRR